MPLFNRKKKCFDYDIIREESEKIIKIYCESCTFPPSIAESSICMAKTVDLLIKNSGITRITLSEKQDYDYDNFQTQLLNELARLIKQFSRDERLSYSAVVEQAGCENILRGSYSTLNYYITQTLKSDPVSAYVQLTRFLRNEKIKFENMVSKQSQECEKYFISLIEYVLDSIKELQIISLSKPFLAGHKSGDRSIYEKIFRPIIRPAFMFTKLMASYPSGGEVLDNYKVSNTEVTIFGFPNSSKTLYHIVPPEFRFSQEKYELLDTARKIMAEHKPKRSEFVDPTRMREVFFNIGRDLIEDLLQNRNIKLKSEEVDELAQALLRYTVGFGLVEILLSDPKIQDISINSPLGNIPIFVVHQDFDDCDTNIIATREEAESWATKLRMISGRPLDEANPILDTELKVPGISSRVAAVTEPLDPTGMAFSFRRHRDKPWTFPLFMNVKFFNSLAAGLLSFLIDGTRTFLIAGTRSSGKTSLLGSVMTEILRRYRIITVEDTLELPTESLADLGFNIQSLKVASALAGKETSEVQASRGIRSTLRLGDSALVIGEVRSDEAIALYEAMRVGAAANVVAGTIHGASPYSVFDRVVNDIGVPKTSFKATDIVVVANPVRSASGLKKQRRVIQITEVRKKWEEDPLREGAFVDLMKYNPDTDQLEVTDELMNGNSEILKTIAGSIKEFAGNWDAVWDSIQLRGDIKKAILDISRKAKNPSLLEAKFTVRCNDMFHKISDKVSKEVGELDSKRILFEFNEWLKKEAKRVS